MNGALAVLAEIDLVDVRVHDVGLLEARLENHGHHRFLDLAAQRAPAVEEVALDELLGERAAALLDLSGAHVGEQRAQDRLRVDSVVLVEVAILDGLQRLREQRRHFVRRDDDAVLAVDGKDAADQQRVEPVDRHVHALRVDQLDDRVAAKASRSTLAGCSSSEKRKPRTWTSTRSPRRR